MSMPRPDKIFARLKKGLLLMFFNCNARIGETPYSGIIILL